MVKRGITWKVDAFQDLRHDKKVRAELERLAKALQKEAGGEAKGYVVRENTAREARAGFTVLATGHAARSNRKHRSLIRALGKVK